jgi:hypothetical protein
MNVIITIDTEADNQWDYHEVVTTENLDYVPRFQALCERYGLCPTYLCTFEVVESSRFEALLRPYQERGTAEIGAHLHPWTNPPFGPAARAGIDKDAYPAYPSELTPEDFRAKLKTLTDRIAVRAGRAPTSYRAGRWGFAAAHVPVLVRLGYVVDCSVTPHVSWANHAGRREGGPDFRIAPVMPYFLDPDDVCRAGESPLLEVPVTIVLPSAAMRQSACLREVFLRHRGTRVGRAFDRVFHLNPWWFRPYPHMSTERLLKVYRVARAQGLPALEMMLHSSELMPGGSGYNPTEVSIEQLYARLERVFARLARDSCRGVTLSAFAQSWGRHPGPYSPKAGGMGHPGRGWAYSEHRRNWT